MKCRIPRLLCRIACFLCRIGTNATPVYKNCYMHPCLCYDE